MYELSLIYPAIPGTAPEWGWSFRFDDTVGRPARTSAPHRNFPRHLFALGLGRHGAGASWLAARILLRQVRGEPGQGGRALRLLAQSALARGQTPGSDPRSDPR